MSRLERWSRLKRNVATEEEASTAAHPAETLVDEQVTEPNASPDGAGQPGYANDAAPPEPEPGSLDHTLPDPETLEAGSDFSAFMAPGVSGPLRRQALKRLWATGNYNVRDGLDDYDADYNQLLKPMSSGLASNLRRWTHKVEEAVDKSLNGAEPEPQKERAADGQTSEQANAVEEEPSTSSSESDGIVKISPLDDQSDYLSGTKTKT